MSTFAFAPQQFPQQQRETQKSKKKLIHFEMLIAFAFAFRMPHLGGWWLMADG
jgi:hypothetical protein